VLRTNEETDLDPDTATMLQFTQGDLDAFETLFNKYSRQIVNYAYKFVGDRALAEDIAQEVFLKVYTGRESYRAEAKFRTWLYKIATNTCLSELRRPRNKQSFESIDAPRPGEESDLHVLDLPDSGQPSPLLQIEVKELRKAIKSAVNALPENQRIAFILGKYQNLPYQEIGAVLRCSESAVKSLIHRAKETLMEKLRPLVLPQGVPQKP
jgi:RNA polymerase sigma-70 factor (ECF subfamily)